MLLSNYEVDVSNLLPKISAPTLVIHAKGDRAIPFPQGRGIANSIPNVRVVQRWRLVRSGDPAFRTEGRSRDPGRAHRVNAGEPVAEEDDRFGTSVQLARRICDSANGGEMLVSGVVRQLVAGKRFLFSDRGAVALRGFEDPVRLYEVRWQSEP